MKLDPIGGAAQTERLHAPPRRGGLLANAVALLILAAASGVLALLLVETDGSSVASWIFGGPASRGADHAAESSAPGVTPRNEPRPAEPAATTTAEEGQAGERQRQLVDTLARDLALVREEVALLKARLAAEVAERLKASAALERANLAAAEHRQASEDARQQAATLARDLESTREQVENLRAEAARAEAEIAEHKQALDRERKRASILEAPAFGLGTPIPVKTTSVSAQPQPKAGPSAPSSQQNDGPRHASADPTNSR